MGGLQSIGSGRDRDPEARVTAFGSEGTGELGHQGGGTWGGTKAKGSSEGKSPCVRGIKMPDQTDDDGIETRAVAWLLASNKNDFPNACWSCGVGQGNLASAIHIYQSHLTNGLMPALSPNFHYSSDIQPYVLSPKHYPGRVSCQLYLQ